MFFSCQPGLLQLVKSKKQVSAIALMRGVAKQLEPLGKRAPGDGGKEKSESNQHVMLKPAVNDKKLLEVEFRIFSIGRH